MATGHGVDLARLQRQNAIVNGLEQLQRDGVAKRFLAEVFLQGRGLRANLLARKAFHGGPCALVGLGGDDGLLGLILTRNVVIGKQEVLRTLRRPLKPEMDISTLPLHRRLASVKRHRLDLQL